MLLFVKAVGSGAKRKNKIVKITKDTKCCISIAESPGNFGSTIFNATFQELKLDFIYKPFKLLKENLPQAIEAIRALDIRGCGVSMPHKTLIHKYLDEVDPVAKKIGAVNTVVNENGKLIGYNTDYMGAREALRELFPIAGKTVHIIGAGGASRAIIVALQEDGAGQITISNRDEFGAQEIAKKFGVRYCPNDKSPKLEADLLINATPVGMSPNVQEMIVDEKELLNYKAVMDVVVNPLKTKLISSAKKENKIVIPGYKMALHQAAHQFTLYTGVEAPIDFMLKEMEKITT
jgi:shikimate dehydrogenase